MDAALSFTIIFYYFAIKCAAVTCKHASVFCLYENNQIKVSTNTFSFNCNPENGPLEKMFCLLVEKLLSLQKVNPLFSTKRHKNPNSVTFNMKYSKQHPVNLFFLTVLELM